MNVLLCIPWSVKCIHGYGYIYILIELYELYRLMRCRVN